METFSLILLGTVVALSVLFLGRQGLRIIFLRKRLDEAIIGTEKRNIQLSYLTKTARTLSSALSKDKLLRLIIETFGDIAKSDRSPSCCALYLLDYNLNRYVYETGYNIDITMLNRASFNIDDHPFKLLKKNREIAFFDEGENLKYLFVKESKLHAFKDIDMALLIPLVVENEVMGIVLSFLAKSPFDFLKKDIRLLQTLTGQAAIALGSAVQSELAVLDRLTKVYNHVYFEGRLIQEVARADRYKYPVSVLMIDIDHFKHINDTYGHQQGDIILKEVASAIKSNIRVIDLCARYGGEEFGVILPETDLTGYAEREDTKNLDDGGGAIAKAENLRKLIEGMEITSEEGFCIKVTVSIGIGVKRYPDGATVGKDELIRKADRQLYKSKQEGRNRVCHS